MKIILEKEIENNFEEVECYACNETDVKGEMYETPDGFVCKDCLEKHGEDLLEYSDAYKIAVYHSTMTDDSTFFITTKDAEVLKQNEELMDLLTIKERPEDMDVDYIVSELVNKKIYLVTEENKDYGRSELGIESIPYNNSKSVFILDTNNMLHKIKPVWVISQRF